MSAAFPGLVHDAEIRHDGSNSYRLMQLGCLESVANSSVAYSSTSPLAYSATGTDFTSPYFSTNHQYTPLHHQSFHYEFQHSHPSVTPDAYSLNSLHHSQQYYQQIHHGEPDAFINLQHARALKSSCLDEQRRELGCLDAYRRHDLSLMGHGTQYGVHPDQRLLQGSGLGLAGHGGDDLQGAVEAQCGLVLNGQGGVIRRAFCLSALLASSMPLHGPLPARKVSSGLLPSLLPTINIQRAKLHHPVYKKTWQ